ncbi:Uncharacterised protein [Mycobacteroides abscessus subsp. abscessus]|nr:Uncharacterised protein [Mycobacteroides abscessus subsp. abscessus]
MWFDADDRDVVGFRPQVGGDARQTTTSADRKDDDVGNPAELLDDFHRTGALAGCGPRVVECVNPRGTGPDHIVLRSRRGSVVGVADRDEFDEFASVPTDTVAFLLGRRGGYVDAPRHLHRAAGIGDALRVVARARRDDARRELVRGQQRHGVVRAADLVGPNGLQVFALHVDTSAVRLRNTRYGLERGTSDRGRNPLDSRFDRVGGELLIRRCGLRIVDSEVLRTHPLMVSPHEIPRRATRPT